VTLLQGQYHTFWAEGGMVMITEVSKVNDDRTDNRFYENIGRFPAIEEDEEPLYLLSMDYETFFK
jgi:D-lyxose ketol-isomerase